MKVLKVFSNPIGVFCGALALLVSVAFFVYAAPTPREQKLIWDEYTDPATGFWIYWSMQAEAEPRIYGDTRRFQLTSIPALEIDPADATKQVHSLLVLSNLPTAMGGMCFKMTAHDALQKESAFSNETCGWLGMSDPSFVRLLQEP